MKTESKLKRNLINQIFDLHRRSYPNRRFYSQMSLSSLIAIREELKDEVGIYEALERQQVKKE